MDEMLGKVEKLKPLQIWNSRPEYQEFPLYVFGKHVYQERTKQLAAPYWQFKRNKNAKQKYEETEKLMKEWSDEHANKRVEGLLGEWESFNLVDDA